MTEPTDDAARMAALYLRFEKDGKFNEIAQQINSRLNPAGYLTVDEVLLVAERLAEVLDARLATEKAPS